MEFFERAHVAQKHSVKKENRSEGAVKKQLKQMLHAYKKGNNQEIKSLADNEQRYDFDDIKSMSDFSDASFLKEADTSQETVSSHASDETQSNAEKSYSYSSENSSSKSNKSHGSLDSVGSVHEYNDEFKSLSSSQDIYTTDKDCSSTFESSILSEEYSDSEISIPSSLQTSSSEDNDLSNEEAFDPDGELANKILEKLRKNLGQSKKRKLNKDQESNTTDKEENRQLNESLLSKMVKKEKKTVKKAKSKDSTNIKVMRVETKKQTDITYRNTKDEISEDSFQDNGESEDSQYSENSSQFISVSVPDMQSQSLSDIVGDYIHPTVKNLPSDKQNIVQSQSSKYAILDEVMTVDNFEDISSLIPEVDEDIAIEDLTLETDPQDPTEEITAYDDTVQTEDYFEQDSSDNIEPTSVPIKVYSCRDNHILVLKYPAEIFVHGKVKVTAIGGSVEVFGYTLQDESIDLYAPYCNIAFSVKTIANMSAFHGLFSQLTSAGLPTSEAEEIVTTVSEHDSVIALSKLNCPKMDFVDNNFTATELFTKRVDQTPALLKKVAENLGCSLYLNEPKRILEEKSSWEQVVDCGKMSQSRGIICGGKGTGKSTLLRYYVNRLVSNGPVLVIDLDPGQAEFTMPGNISVNIVYQPLIGPNFTHLRQPDKMLNIGMINTMDNPSRYISAVKELISFCQSTQSFQDLPWIVNTMGMCNNMGLKFISYIIAQIQPTFVYQIDSKIAKKRYEFELQSHAVSNFYEEHMKGNLFRTEKDPFTLDYTFISGINEENGLSPKKGSGVTLMPKAERYLNVLAYFGQLLDIYGKSILDIVPYEVHLRDLNIGVNVKIPEQAVMKVINGKIIALCQLAAADKGKLFTLDDKALWCHGYGLIRSIDFERELLYILSPVPVEELARVNTLVYADWMPDLQGQEKELPSGTVVPYRTATLFHERQLMFPPRRRFNPIQLLKATRST